MYGETMEQNDLFFTCSLIEYIARKTKNKKVYIIYKLGEANIEKIFKLASVYHCENIDKMLWFYNLLLKDLCPDYLQSSSQ